ncbi:MAG TPA: YhjD/YihY/BrkB family envelope integrity protein [Candidatus Binatia bacterium]
MRLFDDFVDSELSELTHYKRWLHSSLRIGVMVVQDFVQNLVKLQAMALAFKTLLSLAPLLAVVFSLFKAFGVHNRMEPALAEALAPLGEKGQEITQHLIGFVDKMSASALGSVGLVTLFITVLSLMSTIEDAFNHIWRVKSPRKLARRFSDYLSAILVGPVLVFAAVTITATLQNNAIVHALASLQAFGTIILFLLRLIPYVTLWGAFTFVYIFIPNTRVRVRSALIGGLVAALLWQTVGWGFAVFVTSSTRYYVIYSSFAILLLFLLWLHVGWVIVLLGAQVAYSHQYVHFYQRDHDLVAQSPAGREKLALQLLLLIGRNFHLGLDPMNVLQLSNRLRLPAGVVKELLQLLTQAKLLMPLADEDSFVLARDPQTISIKEILDCIRNGGTKIKLPSDGNREESKVNEMLLRVDQSVSKALEGQSLQTLISTTGKLVVSK